MILHLAFTIIVLAASTAATGYIDGREYVYQYKGIISSGFPSIKPQNSGYAYNIQVRIQPNGDHAVFKMENPRRASFNVEYEDVFQTSHEYKAFPSKFLTRPFRVHRKNGNVTLLEVTQDEPSFSVNIKRAFVSLFNLNLGQTESGSNMEDNTIFKTDPTSHYYKVYEDTLVGECETAYVIEHQPYRRSNNIVLNVTKVPDYHKCKTRPNHVYSTFYGRDCSEADYEKPHNLHGNAQYHYSIRGDRHNYVIEKVRTESNMDYSPYPMEGQTVSTVMKRSLELIEEKPVSEPIAMSEDLKGVTSLVYDFDYQKDFLEPIDLKESHFLYHLLGHKVPMDEIHKQVKELMDVYNDESYAERIRDKNFPAKFVVLLRSVATLNYEEIEDLYNTYADIPSQGATEEQKLHRNLFMDILINSGTNPAFLFGKYLIENKKDQTKEALYFLQQLQFHVKEVSGTLLDNLMELCDHNNVKNNPTLHMACVFALSNIVFDHCIAKYHPEGIREGKHVCPHDVAVKYFDYIINLHEHSENEAMKINYVKAAGNIGIKEIIPFLTPYIEDSGSYQRLCRDNAIWALKNVGRMYPDKVRSLLVPVLFNRTEHYELRIASFVVLLQLGPKLYEFEGLARALKYDPDENLRSFVYSTFKSLANSTYICDRKLSKDASYALRILKDVNVSPNSEHQYSAEYDRDYDYGGGRRMAYIPSDTGYIPRSMYLGFDDYIGGQSLHTFGIGMKQFGLEKFFDRIFGPEGSFGRRSVFDVFKKRSKRDVSEVKKELNDIKEKVNLPRHEYDRIYGDIFFKHMGNHINSFQFDENTFKDFFKEGRFLSPDIPAAYQKVLPFLHQRFMLNVDQFYVIPTESGIPMFFDYKQPIYFYHKNKESSFNVEPGFFAEDRGGQYPDHVKAHTDGHFAIDKHLIAYIGVAIPFDKVIFGAGINRRGVLSLPLKIKLDLVVKEKKLKTRWTPVAPHEIYHFKYEPFTFSDTYTNTAPQVLGKGYLPAKKVHNHEYDRHFFHEALGIGFDVHTNYENEFNDFGSWVDFLLKKSFRLNFYYIYTNPKFEPYDMNIQLSYAKQDATKEVKMDFSYSKYDDNWIIPHFPEENFEDLDNHKEDRGPLYTSAIKANVVASGDKKRKIHAVASWTRDLYMTFHKVNFFYERNPFLPSETTQFKICGSSYLKNPKGLMKKLDYLDTVGMDIKVNTELKVHFGKNCNDDQKFDIQGLISRSDESLESERLREEPDTPDHYNEYSYHYHECLKERQTKMSYDSHCGEYMFLITTLHKYDFKIKHENLSPHFLNMTYLLDRILKFRYYTHSDHNEVGVQNPINEVHIEANFSSKLPVADVRVQKPLSNSNYYNVFVPSYEGYDSDELVLEGKHIMSTSSQHCTIESNFMTTFDSYEYEMPVIDCWTVIAADCSSHELFTLLGKKVFPDSNDKAMVLFLGDHKIEMTPSSEDHKLIVIKVDGKEISVSSNNPYLHQEGDDYTPLFYISFRDHYYTINSEKYRLGIEYFVETINLSVSSYYRSKLRGMCGNFNGLKSDDISSKDGCYYDTDKDYALSFAVSSETCHSPEPKLICSD